MNRSAFTLVEVMISAAIGVLMIALVTGALLGIRRVSDFNQILVALHEEAGTIHRNLSDDAGSTVPGAKWECSADPGADGSWNTGDEIITLTWMTAISDPEQVNFSFEQDPRHDLSWCRLRWVGSSSGNAKLLYARNSGFRFRRHASGPYIHIDPLLRRDRRRDLDDNDLRYVAGLTTADYTALAMPGDSQDLDTELLPLHSPNISVRDFRLSWVDRDGWTISASGAGGLSQTDASGGNVPWSGGTWDQATHHAVDGVFLDARPHTAPGVTRPVSAMRPVLLRVSFTLVHASTIARDRSEAATLAVDLSFPLGPELARP